MKKTLTAMALAATIALPAFAADSYSFDPRHTRPLFEINHLGFSTQHGRFDKAAGKVVLDIAAQTGSIDLAIDTASIDMGADDWNKHLKSEDFFNVEKFPTMTFTSDKLIFDGDKVVGAAGSFTLLGVTKPLKIVVANFHCGPHPMTKKPACGADVTATIKRSDFGMTKFLPAVGDEVKIIVPVEASKD